MSELKLREKIHYQSRILVNKQTEEKELMAQRTRRMVHQEPQSTLPTLPASSSNRGTEIEEGDSEDGSETPVVDVAELLDRMELAYTQQAQKMETEYRRREERDGKRLQQEQQREEKRREEEREYRKMESERWMEFMQMTQDANHDLRREEMRNRQKENEEEKQK